MIKKLLVALSLLASPAWAATVNQSGSVTPNHLPYWVTNGAIGDGGTSADSPITSIGVTNNGGSGICVNSARITASGYNALCLGVSTAGAATISLQNYGTAAAQALQFVINGTPFSFPGALSQITIGTTPVVGGTNSNCLVVSAGTVGQQPCNVSAITSLIGDGAATGPGISTLTLATVNANTGTFGNGATVPSITVNGKGLITAVSTSPVSMTVGTSVINSGSNNGILYDNGGVLGNLSTLASAVLITSGGGVPSMSTTLPAGMSIPGPTFTGTVTFPDAATWTASGVSKMVALSTGSATIPAAGRINVSDQYQVNGSQIAASNLSNGTTGSGSVVLNTSPTISGTWAGAVTFSGANTYSGNNTFSAQSIHTGTSAPASAAGNTVIMGTIAAPTLTNTGQAFLYNTTANGAVLQGDGSSFDAVIANKAGTAAMQLTTNTTVPVWPGLANGTCSSGLALDASNNMVKTSCPGAAASIQVGSTTITSGSSGNIEFNNAGTLGEATPTAGISLSSSKLILTSPLSAQGRITLVANTPVMNTSQTGIATLRYDCFTGNSVPYFDGTNDQIDTIASCEVTDAMVSAASAGQVVNNNVYDVWWVHGGANRICLALSTGAGGGGGWSSDTGGSNTARGTGFSQLDLVTRPYPTNKNALANCFNGANNYGSVSANQGTYLGTIYATANGQTSFTLGANAAGGTAATIGVWNNYNRVPVITGVGDNTATWSIASATFASLDASTGNRITQVAGQATDAITASISYLATASGTGGYTVGIGLDVTNAFSGTSGRIATSATGQAIGFFSGYTGIGLHFLQAVEACAAGTCTGRGTNGETGIVQGQLQANMRY